MPGDMVFALVTGFWGVAMVAVFIMAIRLSYRIEARSPDLVNRTGVPRKAMILHTVANRKVARDAETQCLRRRMNLLLLGNLAGFAALWAGLWLTGRT
ncbi:MAG: hypothetical protein ABTQ31_08935 [Rhizobiaceae bacterium]